MLSTIAYFAANKFGWEHSYIIWGVPVVFLMLMLRQESFMADPHQITLSDKEMIDNLTR